MGHPDHVRLALLPDATAGEFSTRNVVYKEALMCGMACVRPNQPTHVGMRISMRKHFGIE